MKMRMSARVFGFIVAITLVVSASWVWAGAVNFKAVAFLPANNANVAGFNVFMDKMNEKFKGQVSIELLGGPEVTPPFQLHEAVKNGVIDMCVTSCGYYPSLLWEAQSAMFTNRDYLEEVAKTDYYKVMRDLHREKGLIWLGPGTLKDTFHLYTNAELKAPEDLSGKKIRVFPPFIPLMKAVGAAPINLPIGDIYTAMERGAIDGFVQSPLGFVTDFSWHEVTDYVLTYPLYKAVAVILVNPKKWNQLSPDLQKAIIEYKDTEINEAIAEYYTNLRQERWDLMIEKGVKPLEFSAADGERFLDTAYDAAWDHIISKSPELGPKLKEMLVK
jgi:TRAP-type C4-dicarboxylate transport system substrate-binding protein